MTFLPIVERELRVAARQPRTYRIRLKVVALALLVGGPTYLLSPNFRLTVGPGPTVFTTLCAIGFFYCLIAGALATADCLSLEKREGTMGFLFLTDLKGYDVVLGKLLAQTLRLFYGLLAAAPVLAIPILQGGVSAGQFWKEVLALVNTLFFSAAWGLMVSASARKENRASAVALIGVLLLGLVLSPLAQALEYIHAPPALTLALRLLSPAHPHSLASSGRPLLGQFWGALLCTHLLGWIFLGVASLVLPQAWQERPAGLRRLRLRERWKQWTLGSERKRRSFRARLLDQNAFFWLASRQPYKPLAPWCFVVMVAVVIACVWWYEPSEMRGLMVPGLAVIVLHLGLRFWVAAEAVEPIAANRRAGTMELLLSTPLTVRDIVRGQWLALRRQFLGPVAAVVLLDFLLLAVLLWGAGSPQSRDSEDRMGYLCAGLGIILMLVADMAALGWVSMWMALRTKQVNQAAGNAVARILFLPWVLLILIQVSLALGSLVWARVPAPQGFYFGLGLWFGLGVLNDLAWTLWSRRQLLRQFRVRAGQLFWRQVTAGTDVSVRL